jgi:hypothetical protein
VHAEYQGEPLSLGPHNPNWVAAERDGSVSSRRLLALFIVAVCAMVALTSLEGALFRVHRGEAIDWPLLVEGRLVAWLTCAAFVPPLYLLTTRLPILTSSWQSAIPVHFAASIVATLGKYSLLVPVTHVLDPTSTLAWADTLRREFVGGLMFYWSAIGLAHAVFFSTRAPVPPARRVTVPDLNNYYADGPGRSTRLALSTGPGTEVLETDEIDWIAAEGNYVRISLGQRKILVRSTLKALSGKLPPNFRRIHRSAIINADKVRRLDPLGNGKWRLLLTNGECVTSGRAYSKGLSILLD